MAETRRRGWHPDPFGRHYERFYFDEDEPGRLVRDESRHESFDSLPDDAPPQPPVPPKDRAYEPLFDERRLAYEAALDNAASSAEAKQPSTAPQVPASTSDRDSQTPPGAILPLGLGPDLDGAPDHWIDGPPSRWPKAVDRYRHVLSTWRSSLRELIAHRRILVVTGSLVVVALVVILIVALLPSSPASHTKDAAARTKTTASTSRSLPISRVTPNSLATTTTTLLGSDLPPSTVWQLTQTFPGQVARLDSVSCPTVGVCESAGSTIYDFGTTIRSINGGASWTQQTIPLTGPIQAVDCVTADWCMAVGSSVITTHDGGTSWTQHTLDKTAHLISVACVSTSQCMAAAVPNTSASCPSATIYATGNGGGSWTTSLLPKCVTPSDITCVTATQCEMAGTLEQNGASFAAAYGSGDIGQTWHLQYLSKVAGSTLVAVACPAANQCQAIGNGALGDELRTIDSGTQWFTQSVPTIPPGTGYDALSCSSTIECQATGSAPPIVTEDAGVLWTLQTAPTVAASMLGVSCPTTRTCIAGGPTTTSKSAFTAVLSSP